MIVVIPLRPIFTGARGSVGIQQAGAVIIILENKMNMPPALVRKRDSVAPRFRIYCEADRQRPWKAAREVQVLDDPEVILASHEPLERRQRAAGDHVEVGELA